MIDTAERVVVQAAKRCAHCDEVKPRSEFFRSRAASDGLQSWCKTCQVAQREYRLSWQRANREKTRGYFQAWRERNPDYEPWPGREAWVAANSERYKLAHRTGWYVQDAIRRGVLTRPENCEECGAQCKPDAAHKDYSKPLDVRWLCRSCHTSWDQLQPKTLSERAV